MNSIANKTSVPLQLAQIAWVIKDLKATEQFMRDTMGVHGFSDAAIIKATDYEGTYYGKPSAAESMVSMAYSGGIFIELIQHISGTSVFADFMETHPEGGIQHIAFKTKVAHFEKVIHELNAQGYEVVSQYHTPIAEIVFFDTYKEIGVMTELMGITQEGEVIIEHMKRTLGGE